MIVGLLMLLAFAALATGLWSAFGWDYRSDALRSILLLVISIFCIAGIIGICSTNAQRAMNKADIREVIGIVTEINTDGITLDNDTNYISNDLVKKIYNFTFKGIEIGSKIKIEYLYSDLSDYITKAVPIEIIEKAE